MVPGARRGAAGRAVSRRVVTAGRGGPGGGAGRRPRRHRGLHRDPALRRPGRPAGRGRRRRRPTWRWCPRACAPSTARPSARARGPTGSTWRVSSRAGDEVAERRLRQLGPRTSSSAPTWPATSSTTPSTQPSPPQPRRPTTSRPACRASAATRDALGEGAAPSFADAGGAAPGRVVAVWGPTGAPGRTTVALNLAAELRTSEPDPAGRPRHLRGSGRPVPRACSTRRPVSPRRPAPRTRARSTCRRWPGWPRRSSPGLRVLTGMPRAQRWTELRAAVGRAGPHRGPPPGLGRRRRLRLRVEDDEELSYDTVAPRRNAATLTALEAADELVVVGAADPVGAAAPGPRACRTSHAVPVPDAAGRRQPGPRLGRRVHGPSGGSPRRSPGSPAWRT